MLDFGPTLQLTVVVFCSFLEVYLSCVRQWSRQMVIV
jgi:hypothetical protein